MVYKSLVQLDQRFFFSSKNYMIKLYETNYMTALDYCPRLHEEQWRICYQSQSIICFSDDYVYSVNTVFYFSKQQYLMLELWVSSWGNKRVHSLLPIFFRCQWTPIFLSPVTHLPGIKLEALHLLWGRGNSFNSVFIIPNTIH